MDKQAIRFLLFIVFSFSLLYLWEEWNRVHQPKTAVAAQTSGTVTSPAGTTPSGTPSPAAATTAGDTPGSSAVQPVAGGVLVRGERRKVETSTLIAEIDAVGGDLRRVLLKKHSEKDDRTKLLELLTDREGEIYVAQSGLVGKQGQALPNHNTRYTFVADPDPMVVRLVAQVPGAEVSKIYRFAPDGYRVDVSHTIKNTGSTPLQAAGYFRLLRHGEAPSTDSRMLQTYTGPAVYTQQDQFQKISFSKLDDEAARDKPGKAPYPTRCDNGWVSLVQHYFVAAWIPPPPAQISGDCDTKPNRRFELTRVSDSNPANPARYSVGVVLDAAVAAPGQTVEVGAPLYVGPQEQQQFRQLESVAPNLDLTKDYGWVTVIASPLFWLLDKFHSLSGNWGLAIILLTLAVKLVLYPLSAASYRSMAHMKAVAPRMQRLQEQFKDDRAKLQQAMMELYKTEKVNPLGGCLPIVVQIPVFFALYWALAASVELRQAPFYLWIQDLSAQDPYFVLPILMTISMVLQQRMNPEPPDPVQAKMMKIMPYVFSIMFFFFPAGLVLYWIVNNVLSMAQQWYVTKTLNQNKKVVLAKGK